MAAPCRDYTSSAGPLLRVQTSLAGNVYLSRLVSDPDPAPPGLAAVLLSLQDCMIGTSLTLLGLLGSCAMGQWLSGKGYSGSLMCLWAIALPGGLGPGSPGCPGRAKSTNHSSGIGLVAVGVPWPR